jgi:hypothetical protein
MDTGAMDGTTETIQSQEIVPTERLFKQSELNEIVGRAKHDAVESFKRQNIQQQPVIRTDTAKSLSEDDVKRLASEELNRHREQWQESVNTDQAQRIVKNFWDKISPGKEKYQDFDSVAGNIDFQHYPNVVQLLAEHVDNASDVLYELGKNRLKLSGLESIANRNSRDAIYEVKRLSESIKSNESASQVKSPNSPLTQQRPSNTGTDSGVLSMADLKRKYRG